MLHIAFYPGSENPVSGSDRESAEDAGEREGTQRHEESAGDPQGEHHYIHDKNFHLFTHRLKYLTVCERPKRT